MKKLTTFLMALILVLSSQSYAQQTATTQGDITLSFQGNEFVDNLHCQSMLNGYFDLVVNNSAINDTIFIIYNGFSQQDTIVNTTGDLSFNVFLYHPNYPNIPYMNGNFIAFSGNPVHDIYSSIDKVIAQNDTLVTYNTIGFIPAMDPGCTYDNVSGNLFIDNNNDCMNNIGDDGVISTIVVQSNYSNGQRTDFEYTNANGVFNDIMFKSDGFIDATFSIPSIYNFAYTVPVCSQIMYTISSLPSTGINFARECSADIDLRTYSNGVWPGARPLIPFNLFPHVSNIGCQPTSGLLELILDPNVTYDAVNSSKPADYTVGNSLFWNYSNLTNVGTANTGYWNQFFGGVLLTPNASVNIGDVLTFTILTAAPVNDANPSNNSFTLSIPIVNSYDPNVKHVEPQGMGIEGFIPAETTKLTYTVDLQNTGNADAINVYILDTLEGNVIPQTLKIVSASHTMNPEWLTNNVLKFNFPQIYLPDSTTNEAESHGFVTFEIDMVQGLSPGTTIENTAYIYFDSNPAIMTNTAKNTIEYNSSINELESTSNGLAIVVYPNPMTESTTFSVLAAEATDLSLELYDMTGKMVINKVNSKSSHITINKNALENGVYIYKIVNHISNKSSNGRLIVQ